jgi:hypothetical protein
MLAFLTRGFHKLSDPASVQVETLERSNKPAATSRKPVIADTPGMIEAVKQVARPSRTGPAASLPIHPLETPDAHARLGTAGRINPKP